MNRFHAKHPCDDFHAEGLGKDRENPRGVVGADLRDDDGDGLRIFVLEIVRENHFADVTQLVPHRPAGRPADLVHDGVDFIAVQDFLQEPLSACVGSGQRRGRRHLIDEVHEQPLDDSGFNRPETGHRRGEFLYFLLVH